MIHQTEIKSKAPIRAEIEAQVAEYLARGGEVKTVPTEVRQDDVSRVKAHLRGYESRMIKAKERVK